jgi:SAM-dependent methyltransferase
LPGDADAVRASVSQYYGATLTNTSDLKTAACCTKTPPPLRVREILARVPSEIKDRYYGCGSPWPAGLDGRRVLDLGCGTGRDVYVASALVGEKGQVIGVDMTEAQLEVGVRHREAWARELGFQKSNVRFVKGRIEELPSAPAAEVADADVAPKSGKCGAGGCGSGGCGAPPAAAADAPTTTAENAADDEKKGVPASWADVIISNCVVNLSPDKPAVLKGAFATLAPGGEMHFSDVYCSRRLSRAARSHPVAVGECLGGALFTDDFLSLCRAAGFARPRIAAAREFEVHDAELREVLGEGARFFSVTFRVFKLSGGAEGAWARGEGGGGEDAEADDADTRAVPDDVARGFAVGGCEDFGQTATYLGTVADHPERFELDLTSAFEKGKPEPVCAATAAALARTWLAPHFEVTAPSAHRGAFVGCGAAGCGGSGAASVQRLADEEEARFAAGRVGPEKTGGGGGCCPPPAGGKGGCC